MSDSLGKHVTQTHPWWRFIAEEWCVASGRRCHVGRTHSQFGTQVLSVPMRTPTGRWLRPSSKGLTGGFARRTWLKGSVWLFAIMADVKMTVWIFYGKIYANSYKINSVQLSEQKHSILDKSSNKLSGPTGDTSGLWSPREHEASDSTRLLLILWEKFCPFRTTSKVGVELRRKVISLGLTWRPTNAYYISPDRFCSLIDWGWQRAKEVCWLMKVSTSMYRVRRYWAGRSADFEKLCDKVRRMT